MSYVPGYEYDIFISYSHRNNTRPPGDDKPGWIERFHGALEWILGQHYEETNKVKIWWDADRLAGNTVFDAKIENDLKKTALLICLNSRAYLASDYCRKERNMFTSHARVSKGLVVDHESRIFNVLLNNIPFSEWPEELEGTSGFHFHDAKNEIDTGDPLHPGTDLFEDKMRDLRDAIIRTLEKLRQHIPPPPSRRFSVFLGETTDSFWNVRRKIVSDLEQAGVEVLPGIPPPEEGEDHEEKAKASVEAADLMIHLLDRYPGKEIIDLPGKYYSQVQAEISLQSAKPKIIWVPSELKLAEVEDEAYRNFLASFEGKNNTYPSCDYFKGLKNNLPAELLEMVGNQRKTHEVPTAGPVSVLLDTHVKDAEYAMYLNNALIDNQIRSFINPQHDDPRENMQILEERIRKVSKMVFLFGNVSKEWVVARIFSALQLVSTMRDPMKSFFIYMIPPGKQESDLEIIPDFLKIRIFNNSDKLSIQEPLIRELISELKTVGS